MKVQLSSEAIQAAVKLCKKSTPDKILSSTVLPPLQSHFMDILVSFCPDNVVYYFVNLNF